MKKSVAEKRARFRELIERPGIVVAPGCYDAIGAHIIEKLGYDVCYMGGNTSMASLIGKPDIGLSTMSEMVMRAHQVSSCINLPFFCDADAGYGPINNVKRTVEEYEASGVCGIHLEDQTTPKKCGAMAGITLVPPEEMVDKIKVALQARTDPNFIIIARSDSKKIEGIDGLLRRTKMMANAGADVVMPECLYTKEEILKVTTAIDNAPVLVDICELNRECMFTVKQLEDWGCKIVINPLTAALFVCKQLTKMYANYKEKGTTMDFYDELMPLPDYQRLLGFDEEMGLGASIK